MNKLLAHGLLALLVFLAASSAGLERAAYAAETAGEVQQLLGRVQAATRNGSIRRLRQGQKIFSGDMLSTGPNSFLRIKYTDGGYMMLRPNTRFVIEEYKKSEDVQEERGFFRLLKGGLRAVTGLIGKLRRKNYRVATPVATIGIRGTDFSTRVCNGDCQDIDPPPVDGLYVGLEHNTGVVIFNSAGQVELRKAGSFAYSSGPNRAPRPVSAKFAAPLTVDPIPSADPMQCS